MDISKDLYKIKTDSPFNVSWMDSWAANWMLHQQSQLQGKNEQEFNSVLRQMVDLKLSNRLHELKEIIGQQGFKSPTPPPDDFNVPAPPPDEFSSPAPPPDDFKSPTPPPDDFRVPAPPPDDFSSPAPPPDDFKLSNSSSPGQGAGMLRENPWILYWFVSINAPLILDMIDAHITRRLNDLKMQNQKQ